MLRKLTVLMLLMAAVGFPTVVFAIPPEEPEETAEFEERPPWYLGAGGTVAITTDAKNQYKSQLGSSADVGPSMGLVLRAGRRGKWIAGELRYEWLEGFDFSVPGPDADVRGWALTLDTKFYPLGLVEKRFSPMARRFQPFVSIGGGYVTFDGPNGTDDGDFGVRVGGGIDVDLTKTIAITVDATYVVPVSTEINHMDYVSIAWGLLFRF